MWCGGLGLSENDETNSCDKVTCNGKASPVVETISCICSQKTGYTRYDKYRNDLTLNLWCGVVRMESFHKRSSKDGDRVGCGTGKHVTCGPDIVQTIAQENLPFGDDSDCCCAGFNLSGDDILLFFAEE